jgi:hypothetical protein
MGTHSHIHHYHWPSSLLLVLLGDDDDDPRAEEDIHKEVEAVLLVTARRIHSYSSILLAYHRDSIRLEVEDVGDSTLVVVGSSQQEGGGEGNPLEGGGEGTWHHREEGTVDVDSNMVVAYHGLEHNLDSGGALLHQEEGH